MDEKNSFGNLPYLEQRYPESQFNVVLTDPAEINSELATSTAEYGFVCKGITGEVWESLRHGLEISVLIHGDEDHSEFELNFVEHKGPQTSEDIEEIPEFCEYLDIPARVEICIAIALAKRAQIEQNRRPKPQIG